MEMAEEFERKFDEEVTPPISDGRKQEIAHNFVNHAGTLGEDEISDLSRLDVREAFGLLSTDEKASKHSAVFCMLKFPSVETVGLLKELHENDDYDGERRTIEFILFQFAHNPGVSEEAIKVLRAMGDSRVAWEAKNGRIEMALPEEVDEFFSLCPKIIDQRDWVLKSAREGDFFTFRTKDGQPACFAIAHQMENYVLYLDYIFTSENHRQQEFATQMIQYLLDKHMVLECHLLRGDMLSESTLKKLGFAKQPPELWVFRKQ